jgi:hypothetical protein
MRKALNWAGPLDPGHAGTSATKPALAAGPDRLIRPGQDCSVSYGYALNLNEIVCLKSGPYRERSICRVDSGWMPGLAGVHSYSRVGEWEAIDDGFVI